MLCGWLPHVHESVFWTHMRFRGFRPGKTVKGVFGDPQARVITLARRSKKRPVALVAKCIPAGTTGRCGESATCPVLTCAFTWTSKYERVLPGEVWKKREDTLVVMDMRKRSAARCASREYAHNRRRFRQVSCDAALSEALNTFLRSSVAEWLSRISTSSMSDVLVTFESV